MSKIVPRFLKLQSSGCFNNGIKKEYTKIQVKPLAAAMGAEILNVSLKKDQLCEIGFEEIKDALFRHKMIFFRNQKLNHEDHEAFTLKFGEFGTDFYTKGISESHPNIQPVVREAETKSKIIFGEGWHTDSPFLSQPPSISMLRSHQTPPYGGDTFFANTELAYQSLSDPFKSMINNLRIHMSAIAVLSTMDFLSGNNKLGDLEMKNLQRESMIQGHFHPLVRTHPVTKNRALYIDETYTQSIQGFTHAEAQAIITFLQAHVTQLSFTCRLRWEPYTFALWDNRSCIHHAFNDHDGFRREMYRTTVKGEVPF
uniref:TauD/TfdA-like domain-containing protein n=1 Tax=Aureoumbra lagunensis TaxID=44058 RepID=A0A7S3NII3_9STRA|mmetsp:Transcript_4769/g.6757  ORF Transcript_4769/g.6757 Transcript_4769/m.6757 type:complete len:312 (+) Transcript_4769:101-1036(+)